MKKIIVKKGEGETLDTFYRGRIQILQKKKGYRFSVDAPLLADFIQTQAEDELLELGTGNGIISLLLSLKPFHHITALEIQESLFGLAQKNVRLNRQEKKISLLQQDLRLFRSRKKYDIIFSNPPYLEKDKGHLSLSLEKSIAKHELKCTVLDIMGKTSQLLKKSGRAYFIYPERRRAGLQQAGQSQGMFITRERRIFPRLGEKPNLFLSEWDFSAGKKVELPPLILYDGQGFYNAEVQEIFTGRKHAAID